MKTIHTETFRGDADICLYCTRGVGVPAFISGSQTAENRRSISEMLSSLTDDRPDAAWRRRQLGDDPTPERDLLYIDGQIDEYLTCFAKPEASISQVFKFCTGEKSVFGWEVKVIVNEGLRRTIDFWPRNCQVPSVPLARQRSDGLRFGSQHKCS